MDVQERAEIIVKEASAIIITGRISANIFVRIFLNFMAKPPAYNIKMLIVYILHPNIEKVICFCIIHRIFKRKILEQFYIKVLRKVL